MKVLLIEDERDIARSIWDFLERRGWVVDHAADGEAGLQFATSKAFDVIVLDLGLPRLDGLELCKRLRAAGHDVPILMLTARDGLENTVRGLEIGADDYMIKPFAIRELEARLRALVRRGQSSECVLANEGLRFDPISMCVEKAGVSTMLTRSQAILLGQLMRASPGVVTKQALINAVWGEEGGDAASLQTHMYELRQIVDRPHGTSSIATVHGIGYRFVAS